MRVTPTLFFNKKFKLMLPGATLIILAAVLLILERFKIAREHGISLSLIMMAFVVIYLLVEFRKSPEHTLSYFFQIYAFAGMLVSSAIISGGAKMIEINQTGNANGTFWILIIFLIFGLEASRSAYYWHKKRIPLWTSPKINAQTERVVILLITVVAICLALFVLLRYSSPLLLHVDRIYFWRAIVPGSLSFIPSLVSQTFFFAVALNWLHTNIQRGRKMPLLILVMYLLVTILVLGEKFSGFILFSMTFFLFLSAHKPVFPISPKIIILFLMGLGAIYFLISVGYSGLGREDSFMLIRVALQSQLNWSVFNYSHFPWWSNAPWPCFLGCGEFLDGKDYISFKYLPNSVYKHYMEGGTGLSGFMPALPILTFGLPLALFFHVAFSFFGGILQEYLVRQLRAQNVIYGFLIFKIHLATTLYWYTANQAAVFGVAFAITLLLCMLLISFHYTTRKNIREGNPL